MEIPRLKPGLYADPIWDVHPLPEHLDPAGKFMQYIKLYGDIPGLVLVHIIYGIPITTLIFRNYFAGISSEILEAGRIDGASLLVYTAISCCHFPRQALQW